MIKRILLVMAFVVASFGIAVSPAVADDDGELPSCQLWTAIIGGPGREVKNMDSDELFYAFTDVVPVPGSWSACEDINVGQNWDAWQWRVRFYPSSGGNYHNAWKSGCQICRVMAATNVSNGTMFRLEGRKFTAGSYNIYQRNVDVWM